MATLSKNNSNDKAFDWMLGFNQEEDLFSQPSSTGVQIDEEQFASQEYQKQLLGLSYKDVEGTEKEKDWLDLQSQLHGTVSEDTRSTIQKRADEFYESGPIGATAAAVADLLPGIPFVDIIDPPSELPGKGMQEARNLLGSLGMLGGLYKTPKAIGRVATNLREPFEYGGTLGRMQTAMGIDKPKDIPGGLWRAFEAVYKDKPLYNILGESSAQRRYKNLLKRSAAQHYGRGRGRGGILGSDVRPPATVRATEVLYRKMFGLKPRTGKDIFKLNKDGTYSFNPENKYGRELLDAVIREEVPMHSVMRNYKRTTGKSGISYEDIWDFKLNPGEVKGFFNALMKGKGGQREAVMGVRALIHPLTDPVHIKGKIGKSLIYSSKRDEIIKMGEFERAEQARMGMSRELDEFGRRLGF
jgi:hypothetical protein